MLKYDNSYGGFNDDNEYVINVDKPTPLPWSNVIANPNFGFIVTESGGGFAWSGNSHQVKLTPWSNDPVIDPAYEKILIHEGNETWTPVGRLNPDVKYTVTHGFGYTKFEHTDNDIHSTATLFVPSEERVKYTILEMHNTADYERKLKFDYDVKPVLGVHEEETCRHISKDGKWYRNGSISMFVVQSHKEITLGPDERATVVFALGTEAEIPDLYKAEEELANVREYWRETLSVIQVKTQDDSFDIMMNGWLLYQTLSCRIWGRSAFYQSGGAYGYRDQLQDVMALLHTRPEIAREHIIRACGHQFEEGDVQHWWHENENGDSSGVRTRFSDDLLWLPYVVCKYIEVTGDESIMQEKAPYLTGPELEEGEDERYFNFSVNYENMGTVQEHCDRAIQRSLRFGEHGLPLMGSGDWNDGMSTVGNKGRGESVWLAFFMIDIFKRYNNGQYRAEASQIEAAIAEHGWDGSWYRRAYFDNGAPLGSSENAECKIDLIAQSWSVISGTDPARSEIAMDAVMQHLVDRENGMIKLLTPPFENSENSPGYIQSYIPGVRENGGQYTHAAAWGILAYALLGRHETARELFAMVNPINHARTPIEAARYKTEPYVVAADVYSGQNAGRGGWTWYTGAAGWLYQVALEGILGASVSNGKIVVEDRDMEREVVYKGEVIVCNKSDTSK